MFRSKHDRLFFISLLPASIAITGVLILFILVMLSKSYESINTFRIELFTKSVWDPENERYGVLSPVIGTFVTSVISVALAIVLSIPLSISTVEFLHGRIRDVVSSLVELMGGIPTIIYAIWSLNILAPFLKTYVMEPLHRYLGFIPLFSCRPVTGLSMFTAGVAIGISLTPYVTSLIIESYKLIPTMYREACLSIGATRYEMVKILLSLSRPAILASAMLGFARAAGETTIAVATVGNAISVSMCLFAPAYTVSAIIASQYGNAGLYLYAESVLYSAALIVLAATLLLSFAGLSMLTRWRERIVV
ncbi:MAG: phosphate ABC transporter permease subunit PstC [Ignisphaera sp.]|nr:phosphate ABC transporter permease subunit PstC [Ignisphaera sp.]MDW8085843.1 phosphate ABC transporter permease subunit PstC [Ignisphaera sp.]